MDLGSFVSGAFNWFGAEQQNRRAADAAEQAQGFSAAQFASRYQTTVADMQAAGLNPMLAYSQGGGSPPSGVQAPVVNSGAAASAGYFQNKVASAQVANVEADTENKKASADLIAGQAAQAWSSAASNDKNREVMEATIQKVGSEIQNINVSTANAREQMNVIIRTAEVLKHQAENYRQQGMSQEVIREQLIATIHKLHSETKLNELDIAAAAKFDNFGREAGQLKPIIDLLLTAFRSRR